MDMQMILLGCIMGNVGIFLSDSQKLENLDFGGFDISNGK